VSTPKLAIRTTCWNYGHFLAEALDSALAQTEPDIEILVIDNGSTDNTLDVATAFARRDPRVRVLVNLENKRLAFAENQAVRATTAPWLLKLDADDTIAPTYVERILDAAERTPGCNCVFSPARLFGTVTPYVYRYPEWDPARCHERLYIPGPAAFTRTLWEALGGFDEKIHYAEDWDFWIRAARGPGVVPVQLPDALWNYRQHPGTPSTGLRMSEQARPHGDHIMRRFAKHTAATVQAHTLPWEAGAA
jgi:glycosyltransferase involved in cell wall biosynthesis